MTDPNQWRRCSACKKPLAYSSTYWVCNVSTCNRKRTGLAFCSVDCWEVHLPTANHRQSWALERTAPTRAEAAAGATSGSSSASTSRSPAKPPAPEPGKRRFVRPEGLPRPKQPPQEVLIVGSRLKDYVRAVSGFNTSDKVLEPLSEIVRRAVDEAMRNARREGRRTVLDRDVPSD